MFILDTDILSTFAKSGEIPLLHELFGDDMGMTPAVMQEIAAPIDYGYEFPYAVINTIKSVQMNNEQSHTITSSPKIKNWVRVNVKQSRTANQPLHYSSPMTEKHGKQQYNFT